MSTRCHIAFVADADQPLAYPSALIYRHSDGYPDTPHGVLAHLFPFLRDFDRSRGLTDTEYLSARCLCHLVVASGSSDHYLGYGISDSYHQDIDFLYVVVGAERQLCVYEREFTPTTDDTHLIRIGFLAFRLDRRIDLSRLSFGP
jgi:hypothetical protein